jgi:hypothetical protein
VVSAGELCNLDDAVPCRRLRYACCQISYCIWGIVGTAFSSICTIFVEDMDGGQATMATAFKYRMIDRIVTRFADIKLKGWS